MRHSTWGDTQLRQHLKRLEEMEYLVVRRGGNQGQLVVYQLPTSEEEANHSSNFAGSEGNFAGVTDDFAGRVRALRGPEKNGESPTLEMVSAATSRLRGNAYRGSEAAGVPQNAIVAEGKPNGHGLARRAGMK